MSNRQPSFAICYTIKNEEQIIRDAALFHFACGCRRIYVYLDGTNDTSAERLSDLPDIVVRNTLARHELENPPSWVKEILPWHDTDMDVRKRINTLHATRLATADNIDWLVCIDPDELLIFDGQSMPTVDHVASFFSSVPADVDQILIRNLEAIPAPKQVTSRPFVDCTLFLNRFPITEAVRRISSSAVLRLTRSPRAQAWFDYIFYQARFIGKLPRLMLDPRSNRPIPAGYFLGYTNHKSAIRCSTASEFNFVVHKWIGHSKRPRSMTKGSLLHFDLFSVEYLIRKFRQRQATMLLPVFHVRYLIACISRECDDVTLRAFFDKHIALDASPIADRLIQAGIAARITGIADFFSALSGPRE